VHLTIDWERIPLDDTAVYRYIIVPESARKKEVVFEKKLSLGKIPELMRI
jgi:hypothetical protein